MRKTAVATAAFGLVEIGALSRGVSQARADEVDIGAGQDATLLGGTDATTNNSLADPGIFAGTDGDGNPKRGLIEFNVAGVVPAGATITGVTLQLTVGQVAGSGGGGSGGTNAAETISLYDETQAWGQPTNFIGATTFGGTGHGFAPDPGDATWNYAFYNSTPWTIAGGDWSSSLTDIADASVTGSLTSFTWSSAAMVADVQNWLDDPAANFGWIIKNADETDTRTFRAFWSAQGAAANDDPGLAPELLVSYTAASGTANLTWNNASNNNLWDTATSSNWNNGSANTVFHAQDNVTFNDNNPSSTSANYVVTLNTLVSPGSVIVNNSAGNYTISGAGTIGGTGSLTKMGTGTLTLSIPNTYSGGTTVSAGRVLIEPTSATTSALPKGALSISGGIVQLADNVTAGTALAASNVVLTSLSITGNGTLDIGNNRIIVDYGAGPDPIASVAAWIKNGFYDLTGPQIISSDIAADDASSGLSYGIGYADGADGAVAGLPSGEIEIMFTLFGDANLDGTVNSEDFTPFSQNLGQNGGWDDGDFNYDGTVNAEDFSPFSHDLGQSASLAAAAGTLESVNGIGVAHVPEPVGFSLIVVVAPGLLCRRRRARLAFTLVHCLVVIAIIAMTVALLVPTIERLREQANLALCKDNLRKIGGALILYARANGGELPVSPTVENPHIELIASMAAGQFIGDPKNYYCPSQKAAGLCFSGQNFRLGIIGYYYYSAFNASTDPTLSKFLRGGVSWPRMLNTKMDPKTWVMSDIWVSSLPTDHAGYRKGVNYLMLDGSVGFVGESPRQQFH